MPVGQLAREPDHLVGHRLHPHLALDDLQHDRAGARPDGGAHPLEVGALDVADAGHQRLEGLLLGGLAGQRQGAEGAPVEAVDQRHDLGPLRAAAPCAPA